MSTKPVGLHLGADDRDELRARADVALHLLAAQVEPAVADAERLVDALLVELERQRRRAREDLELLGLDLDLAGRHRRVDRLGRARARPRPRAWITNSLRSACATSAACGRVLGVDHDLEQALLVAEVDEDEPAVVAAGRDPAGDGHASAPRRRPQRAAALVAPRGHAAERSQRGPRAPPTGRPAPGRRIGRAVGAARSTSVARPAAARLRQLALQRAAGVVGVAGDARARRSSPSAASTCSRGAPSTTKKTSMPRRRRRPAPSRSSASSSRSMPAPNPIPGVGGPPICLDEAVVAAAAADRRVRRSPRARRTRTSCACSSRARARASGRACTATP